ncbi:MAG: hypothetical protein AB7S78_12615 [Candidatus Omnitrophota bacterium]
MPYSAFSRIESEKNFELLKKDFKLNRWIFNNRYRKNCIKKISIDCKAGNIRRDIKKYIAASTPLHCLDGWDFLGKALISYSLGDRSRTKHFAYYAELRAVMSLLAAEGIGIFDKIHFTIDSSRIHKISGKGTHVAVVEAFEVWAKSPNAIHLIEEIIRPEGICLKDWFTELTGGYSSPIGWLAEDWLKNWIHDLKILEKDRTVRNEASYRPSDLTPYNSLNIKEVLNLITEMWNSFTPSKNNSFVIDFLLFRGALQKYFRSLHGSKSSIPKKQLIKVMQNLGISKNESQRLSTLLSGPTNKLPGSRLLIEARKNGTYTDEKYHIQMLCRAMLLLRLSTGSVSRLMECTATTKKDLEFWWEPLGIDRGLWENTSTDPLLDMWSEVNDTINNVNQDASLINNVFELRTKLSKELLILSGCERIGLTGICI